MPEGIILIILGTTCILIAYFAYRGLKIDEKRMKILEEMMEQYKPKERKEGDE